MSKGARRVLITGASGQLGRELLRCRPSNVGCVALSHSDLDITDRRSIETVLSLERPWAIVNTAAYTAVDRAETDVGRATAVNADGPRLLSATAARYNCRFVQISTDYVFGTSTGEPRHPSDIPTPHGVYARTKEEGERAVRENVPHALILRTGWLYSVYGNNFVKAIMALMRTHGSVSVATDQVGTPTWGFGLASAIWRALEIGLHGVHHWTDAGVASWYDFAVAVAEEALATGLLINLPLVTPISTISNPEKAPRPPYSVLDKGTTWAAIDVTPPHWRVHLRLMLKELAENEEFTRNA